MAFGEGKYTYEVVEGWFKPPKGWAFGEIPAVACDSKGRVLVYSRSEHPLAIFDRDLCAWLRAYLDLWLQGSRISFGQLPIAPVAVLMVLVCFVKPLLCRMGVSLSRSELALIFCMLFAMTRFWSSSYAVLPLSLGAGAFYYASPANNYELLHRYIPQSLVPQDKLVIKAFYEGASGWSQVWLPQLLLWRFCIVTVG